MFFFFNDTATTEIYTLSLHDALPIFPEWVSFLGKFVGLGLVLVGLQALLVDRKSTRLNSSHSQISYAVFCLKKKKTSSTTTSLIFQMTSLITRSLTEPMASSGSRCSQ